MSNFPIDEPDDGFNHHNDAERLIIGARIKCDVTKTPSWLDAAGTPLDVERHWIVTGTRTAIQRWKGEKVIDEYIKMKGKPLPDIDALNAGVPEDEWEQAPNNPDPKPPYQQSWYVHLLCPQTMERLTFIGGSVGAKIGVTALQDAVSDWRLVTKSKTACPIVKLTLRPWRSKKWGAKPGPWFHPVRWVDLGDDGGLPQLEAPSVRQIEHKPENEYAEAKGRARLKTIKPPTTEEMVDDEIPF